VREVALFSILCAFGLVSGFNDGGNLIASSTSGRRALRGDGCNAMKR